MIEDERSIITKLLGIFYCRIHGHKKMLFGHDDGGHGGNYHFRCDRCLKPWKECE